MRRILLGLGLACALCLLGMAAPGARASSGLRAFVLAGAPDSFADLQAHTASIGVAYPTYYECSSPGSQVLGEDEPTVSEWIAAHGAALMPRYTCQEGLQVHRLLYDRSLRAKLLRQLVQLVERHPLYRGLSLDLENDGVADRGRLTSFVAELAARLHALGRRLSVVVAGVVREAPRRSTGFYDDRALAALADEVFAMAWGVHWEGSAPGPLAPLGWVRRVARFLASLPHARRFVLGVPMYGLDWAVAGAPKGGLSRAGAVSPKGGLPRAGAVSQKGGLRPLGRGVPYQYANVAALAAALRADPRRDPGSGEMTFEYRRAGTRHEVWYLDARAVAARLRAGLNARLAVGVWRLGNEDQRLWSALP